jgi:hypothetical protein
MTKSTCLFVSRLNLIKIFNFHFKNAFKIKFVAIADKILDIFCSKLIPFFLNDFIFWLKNVEHLKKGKQLKHIINSKSK